MGIAPAQRLGGVTRAGLALLAAVSAGCEREPSTPAAPIVAEAAATTGRDGVSSERRERALRAARVWQQPAVPIATANLRENTPGPGAFAAREEVSCRFVKEPVSGTTAKFNCQLPNGDTVKIKYGAANPELQAEVAASRLLTALGFGADRVYLVRAVNCAGCPPFPFQSLQCLAETTLESACIPGGINYRHSRRFEPAVIERRFPGETIEAADDQGWAWYELDRVDARAGGSPRAEVDALRLLAVVLAHWDNKAENQRLVCLGGLAADGSCARPFAVVHDLGGTFGPLKIDLLNWREYPVWSDPAACAVSMKRLPFGGATFPERRISEEGRTFLLGLLEQLSDGQLHDLFAGSGVTKYDHLMASARDPNAWVAAFKDKVRQIREAGPCPD